MGRKKLYNREEALVSIKQCFWQHGYEGTSLLDLEKATGLPKQTLYREFTDKESMYIAALADYERHEVNDSIRLLRKHDTPAQRFKALFDSILEDAETPGGRRGCFLCNATADRTGIAPKVSETVNKALWHLRDAFAEALEADDNRNTNADSLLAGYIGLRNLIRNHWPIGSLRAVSEDLLLLIKSR